MIPAVELRDVDHFDRLCVLLDRVDETHADQSGTLVFGGASPGVVFVQAGRVCWASSAAMPARLTDRLKAVHSIDEHSLARVFRECRESGRPLGETLVARGTVTLEALREALLQHTAEALLQLAGSPEPEWRPSHVERYDKALSFSAAELLAHSADGWWGPLADRARNRLQAAVGGRPVCGLSFLTIPGTDGSVVPLAFAGLGDVRSRQLLDIGRAAARAMRAAGPFTGRLVAISRPDGRTTLIWVDEGIHYAASGDEPSEVAYIIAHLSRQVQE